MRSLLLTIMTAWALAVPAAAQESTWRASAELGALAAQDRGETPLNPGGDLLSGRRRVGTASLHAAAATSRGRLRANVDTWAEGHYEGGDTRSKIYVNEAVGDFTLDDESSAGGGVTVARWGTGYAWNPANPVLDPDANNSSSRARAYRRTGDGFVRYETTLGKDAAGLYLTRFIQNDPLLSPNRDREWALYGRYQHVFDGGDVSGFVSFGKREQFVGLATSVTVGDQLELHGELGLRSRRRAPVTELIDVVTGAGPQSVPTWNEEPRRRLTPGMLVGGQYTFENRTNLIAEYYYNGNGLSQAEFDQLIDAAAASGDLLAGGGNFADAGRGYLLDANRLVGRLRRHYLFLRVARDEIFRGTDLHYYLRVGLEDGAQVHGAYFRHTLRQGVAVRLGVELYTGPKRSEARLLPVRSRIEATVTFDF